MSVRRAPRIRAIGAAAAISTALLLAPTAAPALKYAAVEHHLAVDPSIPLWRPPALTIQPEQELHIVGADTMDEITLGWVKIFRQAYPQLSVTMEARASGSGGPALVNGTADVAPVARELLPAEHAAFVKKFGYEPTAFRVATGSMGSLGKTAATVVLVDKDNPIKGLSLAQLDAIYSTTRKRGDKAISTWGDLGVAGPWKDRPIHLYGLKPPN
ncbi:MAG: substrate-binding domain-containing protein, partial [Candidatus Eremiobacteraeota bacterium]|nr:substrate-binding domain-containing protein [Candidatus Eremiobacteraeota bacterium]